VYRRYLSILVNSLVQPANLEQLVQYVTEEPSEDVTEKTKFK
jgi:hypothetical protein